jgi:PKD domain/CHAP domain
MSAIPVTLIPAALIPAALIPAALVPAAVCAALAVSFVAGPAAAAPGPAASRPVAAALAQAYASARHLPPGAVAGLRPGSLHLASVPATGVSWAIAGFMPSPAAGPRALAGFQDGASTGVFTQAAGQPWRLVQAAGAAGGCAPAVPAAIRKAWHLPALAGCRTTASPAHRAAANARPQAASAGTWGQSIANVALGQVGVSDTPAVTNYDGVDCDPYSTLVGAPDPSADGCGFDADHAVENENEEWCSDFAKWAWRQAGITTGMNVINAGSVSFYAWGLDQGETMPVDSGTPAPGDAVVFFPPGPITPRYADHVGIVSALNPGGTVNLVDGDFVGASNISVQYSTGVSLTRWAAQVWSPGEQWLLVTPPSGPQQPAPSVAITGPRAAVAGTATGLKAWAAQPGSSVTGRRWTFGDGRDTSAAGENVSHVFVSAGTYTVTMTATSSLRTASTGTWNIDVTAP